MRPSPFGHLPDRAHLDARQLLLHLVRDRGDVRAAIPAVIFDRSHRCGIALRKCIRGFGECAHQQAPVLAGAACEILSDFQRREDRVVFAAAGRDNAGDRERMRAIARADRHGAAGMKSQTPREARACHAFLGTIREPSAIDMPPGIGSRNARHEFAAVRNIDRVTVPGANQFFSWALTRNRRHRLTRATLVDRHGNIQERRKSHNIVAPKNRLQFSEVAVRQIRPGIHGTVIDSANFERQCIGCGRDQQICAQGTEFAREAVADVQRDFQRGCRHRHAERERGGGQRLAARLPGKRIADDSKKHSLLSLAI